jgi:hypothetical protein
MANMPKIISSANDPPNKAADISVFCVKEAKNVNYPDFIESPLHAFSDEFKSVIEIYNQKREYKAVVLVEEEKQVSRLYWRIELPDIQCLDESSEYYPDKTIKKIVINSAATRGESIFKIKNKLRTIYVTRLELLESALRRNICSFDTEELESV